MDECMSGSDRRVAKASTVKITSVERYGGRQEKRYPITRADGDPSDGYGERRGVSPPVLHPPAFATIFEVPTGGLTPRRSLRTGSRRSQLGFLLPPT